MHLAVLTIGHLELSLTAYEPNNLEELSRIFSERVILLYKAATGTEARQKLHQALQHKKSIKFREGNYFIRLEKSIWGNITEGYDLIFTISIKND